MTGILAGPHGLGLVKAVHEVEVMAEIGMVMGNTERLIGLEDLLERGPEATPGLKSE